MIPTKKKTGRSIERAIAIAIPYHLCKPDEWYTRKEVMDKLEEINPLYLISVQSFSYWIRYIYKGSFKKQGSTTLYQGQYINPVLDALISFKGDNNGRK